MTKPDKKTAKKKKKGTKKTTAIKMTNTFRPKDMPLVEWQVKLRQQQAEKENFTISQVDEKYCPGEYRVSNFAKRTEYKVVYRGEGSPWNYCSCLDFRTSQLGTCKHLEAVKSWVKTKRKRIYKYEPAYTSVYVDYKDGRNIKIRIGDDNRELFEKLASKYFDKNNIMKKSAFRSFDSFLSSARAIDDNFRCYDDALNIVIEKRDKEKREVMMSHKYTDEVLDQLLTVSLYPYQKEGVRFALNAGKAIIADEMGLGKTVQAIAAAEIYYREGLADNVLIVCPTSLKYQWKREIERFTKSDADVLLIEGAPHKRALLYKESARYKIVSYHTASNDIKILGKLSADVLIMDEIQRLKNWDTQIARAARKIESRYSVLLSGTPMENKLEELYANIELVDQFCLGPYYLFRDKHILLNPENGAIAGYKNLNSVGKQIADRLIRRTKKGVQLQLPKRSDQNILVPMTQEQKDIHAEFKWDLTIILHKFEKYHFITEADRLRILLLLGKMRMVADSTFILDQDLKNRHDVKIDEVMNLLENIFANGEEKVVIFSEWERMTRLVALELEKRNVKFEYFNGRLTAKQRGEMVDDFINNPESKVFISTDAGSTGLNLQVASTLINLDLPWNPAVLEQRVARIFRIGQEKPVQVINLVSAESFEESLIGKLRFKSSMAEGVLDGGADTVFINEDKFKSLMADLSSVLSDMPDEQSVCEEPEEKKTSEDAIVESLDDIAENESTVTETNEIESTPNDKNNPEPLNTDNKDATTTHPQQLISQGISFLSGLAETLKSPEATKELIDNIVETDTTTGKTSIKIPVSSRETVEQVVGLFQKLFAK